jgi:hypothetical protein
MRAIADFEMTSEQKANILKSLGYNEASVLVELAAVNSSICC